MKLTSGIIVALAVGTVMACTRCVSEPIPKLFMTPEEQRLCDRLDALRYRALEMQEQGQEGTPAYGEIRREIERLRSRWEDIVKRSKGGQ